jgi:hypothetical protein
LTKEKKQSNIFKCETCDKILSSKQGLDKHKKKCKKHKSINIDNKQIYDLLNKQIEEIAELKEQIKGLTINNTTNSNNNNNITNITNINNTTNLISYNNTNDNVLSNKRILKCMAKNANCIPQLIKAVHFNPNHPEHMNILMENCDSKFIKIYNGDKWILLRRDELLNELIDNKHTFLQNIIEEWKNSGKYEDEIKRYSKYIDAPENELYEIPIKENIIIILCDNSDMIENK